VLTCIALSWARHVSPARTTPAASTRPVSHVRSVTRKPPEGAQTHGSRNRPVGPARLLSGLTATLHASTRCCRLACAWPTKSSTFALHGAVRRFHLAWRSASPGVTGTHTQDRSQDGGQQGGEETLPTDLSAWGALWGCMPVCLAL
jgi:hypothetical protein